MPLAKLVLWRLSAEGLDRTDPGMRIARAAALRFPELGRFGERNPTQLPRRRMGELRQALAALLSENPAFPSCAPAY